MDAIDTKLADHLFLANACQLAYQPASLGISAFNDLGVRVRTVQAGNVFAYIIEERAAVFRGSEVPVTLDGIFDWASNLSVAPTLSGYHSGFMFSARSIMPLLPPSLHTFSGHSLGGALAVMAWLAFQGRLLDIPVPTPDGVVPHEGERKVITFGCPRLYTSPIPEVLAYVNADDPVPNLPVGYAFVGVKAQIGEIPASHKSNPVYAIESHFMHAYIASLGKLPKPDDVRTSIAD